MTEAQFMAFCCIASLIMAIDDRNRGNYISAGIFMVAALLSMSRVAWLFFRGAV